MARRFKEQEMRGTAIPFYHSINRKVLIMGVNKELFNLIVTLAFILAFSGRFINLYTDILAAMLFSGGYFFGRKITAVDPQIMEVYRRHIHMRDYYPPLSGIHAYVKPPKPSVPFYEGKP